MVGVLYLGTGVASAACAPPSITVDPTTTSPGYNVVVSGSEFYVVCNDMVLPGQTEPLPLEPRTEIQIVFEQNGVQRQLGVVDADPNRDFSTTVEIPGDATAGTATITASGAPGVTLNIVSPGSQPSAQPGELPRTGRDLVPAVVGALFVALGAVLVLGARLRGRRTAEL